jgi:P-type Ca2+ transporter type 2C
MTNGAIIEMPVARSRGLTSPEAERRLVEHGPNALPEAAARPLWMRFADQFRSPLIYILLFAVAFDLVVWLMEGASGVPFEAAVIGAVLLLNATLGLVQEFRSENALAQLRQLAAPQAWVLRDGVLARINASGIVPGDIVRLEAGDRVPADGLTDRSAGLLVDESVLTGESIAVDKMDDDEVFSGTLAVRGSAFVEVTRTGPESTMGRLAVMLGSVEVEPTPLERRLHRFGRQVAIAVFGLAVVIGIAGVAVEGVERLDEVVLFAVALAVAAVPEGMPAVVTLTLASGVQRMSRRHAVVRRLSAVEALGSVTVIATDKTGTLTENRMSVRRLESPRPDLAIKAMILASDADDTTGAGDPLELGLLAYARQEGVDPDAVRAACPRIHGKPFDAAWKFMRSTVHEDATECSYLKGAAEVLIGRSNLPLGERQAWAALADEEAGNGFRVLGVARGPGETEEDLEFLGLVMIWDPPRPEVPAAMAAARSAGVRVLMITGDHPATAAAVARSVGLDLSRVMTGDDLNHLEATELAEAVRDVNVFARVDPAHKLRIVEALKANGEIVAVTGDGVNDAPALKRSDVGIAMGQRGSDVAREVADLVLVDDDFATIVAAIEEGRSIYDNIQKFIRFLFSTNVALVLLVVLGTFGAYVLDLRDSAGMLLLPLTAIQLLWINFIADGPPALAIGFDRNAGVMERPPRAPSSALLDRPSLWFIGLTGAGKALVGLTLLMVLPMVGIALVMAQSAVFLYESVAQLVFAYPSRRVAARPLSNRWLNWAVVFGIGLQLLVFVVPALREILGVVPLDPGVWLAVLAAVLVTWIAAEGVSRRVQRR